jgi:hypothetical protein
VPVKVDRVTFRVVPTVAIADSAPISSSATLDWSSVTCRAALLREVERSACCYETYQ